MADSRDGEIDSEGHVQFTDEVLEPKQRKKVELTQRYDRKEIQKRLDIEHWMDEQLKCLYQCEVRHYN